jgi:hypothetical protein
MIHLRTSRALYHCPNSYHNQTERKRKIYTAAMQLFTFYIQITTATLQILRSSLNILVQGFSTVN